MNSILLWLQLGIPPWRCPVCYTWDAFEWGWHGGQCYGGCDGTGIHWAWLRYLGRLRTVMPTKFRWWWLDRRFWQRCPDCNRLEYVLGRAVGKHSDCIPF